VLALLVFEPSTSLPKHTANQTKKPKPRGCVFCTIETLELTSTPAQRGWHSGHRGVWLEHGGDNVLKR
jgi:hypothetical protein